MGKKNPPAKAAPQKAKRKGAAPRDEPPGPAKRKPIWPYTLVMLLAWGVIFGAIFVAHVMAGLPDVGNLMATAPTRDVSILDDRGNLIARRGLTRGMAVEANRRPTINIVPRRIKPSEILVAHDGCGSNDTTAPGNTRFPRFPIRVQDWGSVNWSQNAPAEGNPCVFKRFQ